jgi:DNA-binding HxlR family transcriptional regulator
MIILRNILVGCQTFNEIADGAPGLSRGLLSKRLRELERAGIIEIRPKPDGPGSTYDPPRQVGSCPSSWWSSSAGVGSGQS